MATSGAPAARQPRRGPAPIASFDHDGSDESSPEGSARGGAARLPEIREDASPRALAPPAPEQRARSHSTPGCAPVQLVTPTPRIDISRASSSSHHDSRDSSPELALFAAGGGQLALGFREDGALELRSSTEELAFLEPVPGERVPPAAPAPPAPAPPPPPAERRHSRKDSQSSEAALLGVSGRTSRLSSVGSQCSALSRVSRLSVASGASRSPSPHRMLLETSFCGPKPIETDPEISAGALVDQILGLVDDAPPAPAPASAPAPPPDARDRREVRTEVTVEKARPPPAAPAAPAPGQQAAVEVRRARPRLRREPSEPEVYKSRNKTKDIIRIKLRPDDSYEEEEGAHEDAARKPVSLELGEPARPEPAPAPPPRSPSPNPAVSRKSSFCSLFKSRETIASPESPSEALRRKRSLTEGRPRSASRDRSSTPTSGYKVRGSVLSLFRTPRRSVGGEHEPTERARSPGVHGARPLPAQHTHLHTHTPDTRTLDNLKYYEDTKDGIIHIPLRTPPDERPRRSSGVEMQVPTGAADIAPRDPRPASAPQPRLPLDTRPTGPPPPSKPIHRTVLPDGSIIIPLHSPTERPPEAQFPSTEPDPPTGSHTCGAKMLPTVASEDASPPTPVIASESAPPPTPEVARQTVPPPTSAVVSESAPPLTPAGEDGRARRKERLVFTTHVGSREQVFSTQFSITKTPSLSSEISGSLPSFEGEPSPAPLRDTHITATSAAPTSPGAGTPTPSAGQASPGAGTPADGGARDSSESEPSSEAAPSRAGNDVEKRILVVAQESLEEELPWVPTTLPQERSVALPMVPVRERGGVRVSGVQRPRAAVPPAPRPAPPPPRPATADKINIKLPRRPRTATAPHPDRKSTTSTGDTSGNESRSKSEWIDFEEVPERRKQPKRIQTLPAAAAGVAGGVPLVFSYVEPEHCRCECHARGDTEDQLPVRGDTEDQLPLLTDHMSASVISSSSAECGEWAPQSPGTSPAPGGPGGLPGAPGACPPGPGVARGGPS